MKGGKAGETDWSALEKAPSPEHYADFAQLVGTIARRYPDIRHFIVWNELKGFYDEARNRWDYEGYTRLYNLVYKELKKIDKNNQVGGPYAVMDSHPPDDDAQASDVKGPWGSLDQRTVDAVEYWNAHKAGADFVVVDGSSYTKDGRYVPDAFAATRKFADIGRWLRATTGLPLWWAEWYVEVADENDDRNGWSEPRRTAVQASALISMTEGGATSGFYWNPESEGAGCPGCLWRSTQLRGGGGELPMMDLLSRFSRAFPPGTSFVPVDVAAVTGATCAPGQPPDATAGDTVCRPVRTTVDGRSLTLKPYEIRWEKVCRTGRPAVAGARSPTSSRTAAQGPPGRRTAAAARTRTNSAASGACARSAAGPPAPPRAPRAARSGPRPRARRRPTMSSR
ncbi:Xylan 1,4-beta-xylosidase OS=Streptomyces rimosus subsp. rimosus (strain ATCC / DSM 40260 / JCM 4667 / NRRL 2234) OX=1265868 GN=SRIM_008340 PE=3 SV=1 [Streptomyces rimosus subsp. rimosus]